jgi:hypothetical protein
MDQIGSAPYSYGPWLGCVIIGVVLPFSVTTSCSDLAPSPPALVQWLARKYN